MSFVMVCDWDDFHEHNHRLDLLHFLHDMRPDFKCTLFAVPGLGTTEFWNTIPLWCELAVHGWMHPTPLECANWTYDRAWKAISQRPAGFVKGWKSPGWQTSQGTYAAMRDAGWWIADQHNYDEERPEGLLTYMWEDGDNWHGHIQNDCGNGLEETWEHVVALVRNAESFEFASSAVVKWDPAKVARRTVTTADPSA